LVRIFGRRIKGLPFLIAFVITIIFFVIAFELVGIPVNENLTIAIFGFGLMSGGFVSMWMRGILHQGHFSIIVGLIFIVIGGVMFYGVFSFAYTDESGEIQMKEKLWELTAQESGVFILLMIVGVASFISGLKQMMGSQYFWGMKRG